MTLIHELLILNNLINFIVRFSFHQQSGKSQSRFSSENGIRLYNQKEYCDAVSRMDTLHRQVIRHALRTERHQAQVKNLNLVPECRSFRPLYHFCFQIHQLYFHIFQILQQVILRGRIV